MSDELQDDVIFTESLSFNELYECERSGRRVLCPKCKSPLIIALDLQTANKYRVHTGIYCSTDMHHVCQMIELAGPTRDFWNQFKKRKPSSPSEE